jgi:hypothetical protein
VSHVPIRSKPYEHRTDAEWAMNQYYKLYHPFGYGTSLRLEQSPDGWRYVGGRWDSCD